MLKFEEIITRYLLSKSDYSSEKFRVKPRALEPASDNLTSVFRISQLDENSIWQMGKDLVSTPRHRTLYARADFCYIKVVSLNLNVRPDEPPPRHANIYDWPNDKDARMVIAQELAANTTLVINPEPLADSGDVAQSFRGHAAQ